MKKRNACVCVYSNSRNDVPRVSQRYGTIAAHIRRRAFVNYDKDQSARGVRLKKK